MGFFDDVVGAIFGGGGDSSTTVTQTNTQQQDINFNPTIDVANQITVDTAPLAKIFETGLLPLQSSNNELLKTLDADLKNQNDILQTSLVIDAFKVQADAQKTEMDKQRREEEKQEATNNKFIAAGSALLIAGMGLKT